MNRPPTFHAASYLIVLKDDCILLIHRANTGWMDGYWGLPAGHIEGTETVAAAACRETAEEIGLLFSEDEIELKHVMHRPSNSERIYFDFFFTAKLGERTAKNGEPDKHDELKWFPLGELPENIIPYLRRTLSRIQNNVSFSEDVTE